MLFATPIVKDQVKLDPRFSGLPAISDENLATIAMERRGQRDLELMRYVNSLLKDANGDYVALRLYNGSGERLWLDTRSFTGESGVWKYPPDLFIDPGQWSVVIAKGAMHPDSGLLTSRLALSYTGNESEVTANWHCEMSMAKVVLTPKQGQPTKREQSSVGLGDRVALVQRGYAGNNIIIDGTYTTLKQFPYPTSKM